ncbi:hypothetical protein V5P93_000176 [Actinokineospora auranticolor]|uniref:Uncharacterized protein n=1 Tax=Actinokineospora auranticolor TaxID=155976 RepID=A0A2S6GL64_9PSEU|nr:hypothetical protein [Actinokineospora auranticolor]PPK65930.1 hypothetical protein CLV40_112198 [Actinokineospora auranticolor]
MNEDLSARLRTAAKAVGGPVWSRLRPRFEQLARQQAHAVRAEAEHRMGERLDDVHRELDELRVRADHVDRRVEELQGHIDWLYGEQRRYAPQLAALEARLAELERGRVDADTGVEAPVSEEEIGPVAALVEEIRVEHARVRTRLGLVARYEERIARLEHATEPAAIPEPTPSRESEK